MWKAVLGVFMLALVLAACESDSSDTPSSEGGPANYSSKRFGQEFPNFPASAPSDAYQPEKVPILSLQIYMEALANRVKDPNLPLYTKESRSLLQQHPVSDAQQARELKELKRRIPSAMIEVRVPHAVIRFPVRERMSPPYFLRAGRTGWELDLAAMNRLIGLNQKNLWHFTTLDHEYMFAFKKDRFDESGYLKR